MVLASLDIDELISMRKTSWIHTSEYASITPYLTSYFFRVYDREFGHLFQKEPDTPGGCCGPSPQPGDPNFQVNPVQNVANDLLAQFKAPPVQKAEFTDAVQAHYGNMYADIQRINQEMDLMAKAKKANSEAERPGSQANGATPASDALLSNPKNDALVPADIPLPGAKSSGDEKHSS